MAVICTLLVMSTILLIPCVHTTTPSMLLRHYGCRKDGKWYHLGEAFYQEEGPCDFKCECMLKEKNGSPLPMFACTRRCPELRYPPCCEPVYDGCCLSSFVCPAGECCIDEITSKRYKVGDTWIHNNTCNCTCLGEMKGRIQYTCSVPRPTEQECTPDGTSKCTACPQVVNNCRVRKKCEKWAFFYKSKKYICTCHGNRTICKQDITSARRKRRASSQAGMLEEIYITEGWLNKVEATEMIFEL